MSRKRKPESLQIVFWNANGVSNKRDEIVEFVSHLRPDLLLVQETLLKPTQTVRVPNYTTYRNDRHQGRKGGTAVYIRSNIDHHVLATPTFAHMEATSVVVNTQRHGPLKISSVYNPPTKTITNDDIELLFRETMPTIVAGDLNAKHPAWNSRSTNRLGRQLSQILDGKPHIIVDAPVAPTFYHNNPNFRPDILDIALLRGVRQTHSLTTLAELSSDHNPVLLQLGLDAAHQDTITIRKTDWSEFTRIALENIGKVPDLTTTDDIDKAVNHLTATIQNGIEAATNTRETPHRAERPPQSIIDLISEKNRARKRAQRTLAPDDRTAANALTAKVRARLKEWRSDCWQRKVLSLDNDRRALFKMTKALRNRRAPIPPIHGLNGVAYTNDDKAEAFAVSLEDQFSPNYRDIDVDHVGKTNKRVRRALRETPDNLRDWTDFKEVSGIIRGLESKKASGHDGISNVALKNLPRRAVSHLVAIVNGMLRHCYFPKTWKIAKVINIPKPGKNHTFPQDYRPISLLPHLSKVAERVILKRLKRHTEENNILPTEQFGFRPQHSTTDQALRVTEIITEGFNQGKCTGAVFLDVSKAFDKVWHTGLLDKLLKHKYPTPLILLIKSFLSNRKFQVTLNDSKSTVKTMTAGVPQGSTLSPLLFNIFTADIPKPPLNVYYAQYADDTAILSRSRNPNPITDRLQGALNSLELWLRHSRIAANAEKSAAVFFSKRRGIRAPAELKLNNRPIPWKDTAKYLGVTLDKRLTWGPHFSTIAQKGNMALGMLYPLVGRQSSLDLQAKVTIYKTIIRPMITYAAPAWATAAPTHLKRLQVYQNKVLRAMVNAPWFVRNTTIHRDLNIDPIADYIMSLCVAQANRVANHPNEHLRDLSSYEAESATRHKRPRMAFITPAVAKETSQLAGAN